ncbi:MAG: hypothetical protein IPL43_15235 [Micropruina sp.]|nr:hypothetical protein [Micropruina sp.]
MNDVTEVLPPPKATVGYALLESDPRRLDSLSIQRRLRPGHTTLSEAQKPVPFLGVAPGRSVGAEPELIVVKIAKQPLSVLDDHCLREEEIWARAEGLFHSSGNDANYAWVTRAYLQGTPLHELDPGTDNDTRRLYATYLAEEIARFHRSGEAHLDVKPSNVIITPAKAWLIDFEASRGPDAASSLPLLSTANFASPEQISPQPGVRIGPPSDIFSWGLTVVALYRPGYHPYCQGQFNLTLMQRLTASPGQRPSLSLDFIPERPLREAVHRALTWEAAGRPTAAQVISLLAQQPSTMILHMPATKVIDPKSFAVEVPWWRTALLWVGPAGPLGERTVPGIVVAATLVAGVAASLLLALVLSAFLRGMFGG